MVGTLEAERRDLNPPESDRTPMRRTNLQLGQPLCWFGTCDTERGRSNAA